jgi:hypothetical protein
MAKVAATELVLVSQGHAHVVATQIAAVAPTSQPSSTLDLKLGVPERSRTTYHI